MRRLFFPLLLVCYIAFGVCGISLRAQSRPFIVGSKAFTESVILGEILKQRVETGAQTGVQSRVPTKHVKQLGGTRILWNALLSGEIDAYPEYTGTILAEILATEIAQEQIQIQSDDDLRKALFKYGVVMSAPLGFANTYALGVKRETSQKLGLQTISDLTRFPDLRFAFSNEFMDRHDGWRGLQEHYRLPQQQVRGLEHDIAYRALAGGALDLTELYSTDAEIAEYNLTILTDDKHYFPDYRCVVLHRTDIAPEVANVLASLTGAISQESMTSMNASAKMRKIPEERIASAFLSKIFPQTQPANSIEQTRAERILTRTVEHLNLTAISLLAAILVAVPLGACAAKFPRFGFVIMGATGALQTVPSLALLVLMIPMLGIGAPPAIFALFLYSLLPMVRSTSIGITSIPAGLRESAIVLGLPAWARLWRVELPLASPSILAGIKTSAVINIGTATLGAIIGAGGHGQPILTGIRLADNSLILEGAVPAALLALVVQWLFECLERYAVPRGLRL
jgi:osmoprotectant transport system permease protein